MPNGKIVIKPRYHLALKFLSTCIAPVVDDTGWLYIDVTGRPLIRPFVIDNGPDYFHEKLARFVQNKKFGYFDTTGAIKIKPVWDFARPFSEGLAAVCSQCKQLKKDEHTLIIGGKWGYIDHNGVIKIPLKFQQAFPFVKGYAKVKLNNQWYTINKEGNLINISH